MKSYLIKSNEIQSDRIKYNQIQSNRIKSNENQSNPIKSNENQSNDIRPDPVQSDHKEGDGTQHHSASDSLSHRTIIPIAADDSVTCELALGSSPSVFAQTALPVLIPRTMSAARRFPALGLREFDQLTDADEVGVGHALGDVASGARRFFAVFAFV